MHSRYREVNQHNARCQDPSSKRCYGGFARVRAAIVRFTKEAEKRGMPTLYLDAGDVFQKSIYYTEFKWKLAIKMMNLLRPHAMSLGNHEFDDGVEGLVPFVKGIEVPIVCCNIDVSKVPELKEAQKLMRSKVFDFDGTKVGVVGYLTQDIPPKNLGNVEIHDEIESLQRETERLKRDGVNIIIALGHSGFKKDKIIAEKVKEIDVVVGGHSHTFLYSGKEPTDDTVSGSYPTIVQQASGKEVLVVQASHATKYLGYLELEFDHEGQLQKPYKGTPVLLTGEMEQDDKIFKKLEKYDKKISEKYHHKIGHTQVLLHGRSAYCRFQECNMGNLIADAFVNYVNKHSETGRKEENIVQVGLVQSTAIKASLFPKSEDYTGDILLEDVMAVLPYRSSLEVLQLKGGVLRQVLESGVKNYNPEDGGLLNACLLQVSGLRVQFDLTKERGSRLTGVQVAPDYRDLQDDASYNVVMTDYLASDVSFPMLSGQPRVLQLPKGTRDYDVVAKYIEERSPLKAEDFDVEGRITGIKPKM